MSTCMAYRVRGVIGDLRDTMGQDFRESLHEVLNLWEQAELALCGEGLTVAYRS